jgi:hypothetical protein
VVVQAVDIFVQVMLVVLVEVVDTMEVHFLVEQVILLP